MTLSFRDLVPVWERERERRTGARLMDIFLQHIYSEVNTTKGVGLGDISSWRIPFSTGLIGALSRSYRGTRPAQRQIKASIAMLRAAPLDILGGSQAAA
jgi:hypothetical protein